VTIAPSFESEYNPGSLITNPVQAQGDFSVDRVLSGRRILLLRNQKLERGSLHRVMPNVAVLVMGPAGAGKVLIVIDRI
jgi:hypothetical protein